MQGLSDGVFDPSQELYSRMIAHVDDLARIVEDLRTLGLFSAGQLELKLGKIDLGEEATAVVEAIKHDLSEAGITIESDLGRAMVIADSARIRQILFAVLENARRYAPHSTVRVETRVTRDRAYIRCSDTGPGLPPGSEALVFERFWRGEQSRGRASGGSGLGLPIVQAIARAHGGDASVVANDGKGTCIEIWLPASAK